MKICLRTGQRVSIFLAILIAGLHVVACSPNIGDATASRRVLTPEKLGRKERNLFRGGFNSLVEPGVVWKDSDLNEDFSLIDAVLITFRGGSIQVEGEGAVAEEEVLRITDAGTYIISGELKNGQIHVIAGDESYVRLILNGIDLTSNSGAPLYIESAHAVVITLAEGTENTLTDAEEHLHTGKADVPTAALFSASDLTINGSGTLIVFGKHKHGIAGNNDLRIINGRVKVNAADVGIKGNNLVAFRNARIAVKAGSDGIQARNEQVPGSGLVYISGGIIEVYAAKKGIQAAADLVVVDGELIVESGHGC